MDRIPITSQQQLGEVSSPWRKTLPGRARPVMSSPENISGPIFKKRRSRRACDYCRSKKVKCDGPKVSNNRCSNCTVRRAECTYVVEYNSGYPRSYVETLEGRVKRMEQLVGQLYPAADMPNELQDNHEADNHLPLSMCERSYASESQVGYPFNALTSPTVVCPTQLQAADDDSGSDEEAVELNNELSTQMRKLSMQPQPFRYHGKSSGLVFIQSAMALKHEYTGPRPIPKGNANHPWLKAFREDDFPVFDASNFPAPDLMDVLVDLYFHHVSLHYPLLHEPTVRGAIRAGQHLRHGPFGATVLLMCAIGARFTRDPRVLLDGSDHPHSAGWRWFALVEGARRLSFAPTRLHNLQLYALMALFLLGSTTPQASWTVIGAGIRAAIDIGAHRRKMYTATPTVEEELWRRAFWTLVLLEWMMAYSLGRPSSIHDEDFDLALPTECDDEYWLTPEGEPLFEQPQSMPSKTTAFVCTIRLGWILALVMRTIYSSNKPRAQHGQSDQQWEPRVVAELDSSLNKWMDSLPGHLRWNPEEQNVVFLTQAATLNSFYNLCQMAVHRNFLGPSRPGGRESALSLPSAIICTNAARSSLEILEVLYNRTGSPNYRNIFMLFLSGTVLVTNAFALKRADGMINARRDLELVGKAVQMMRALQNETHFSELLAELLEDLVSAIYEPLPTRARTSDAQQGTSTEKAGMGRPRSAIPLSPERSLRKEHTEGNDANWLPTAGDMYNASVGFPESSVSFTSAHPGTAIHMPPTLDFLQPGTPLFALPFGPDRLAPYAQGFVAPFEGSTQHGGMDHVTPPSTLPEPHEYSFLPRCDPPQAESQSASLTGTDQVEGFRGKSQLDVGAGHMSGPEEAPWSSDSSSPLSPIYSQVGMGDYSRPQSYRLSGGVATGAGGDHTDMVQDMPHFGLMNDALMVWPDFPPSNGWADRVAHSGSASNTGMGDY